MLRILSWVMWPDLCFKQSILAAWKGQRLEAGRPIRKGGDSRMDPEVVDGSTTLGRIVETEKSQRGGRSRVVQSVLCRRRVQANLTMQEAGGDLLILQSPPNGRGRPRFDPWARKIPWRRKWQPTPVFLPGEFHGQRSLARYSSWHHRVWHDWATNTFAFTVSTTESLFIKTELGSSLGLYSRMAFFKVLNFSNHKMGLNIRPASWGCCEDGLACCS